MALADSATGADLALEFTQDDPVLLMLVAECRQLLTARPLPSREVLECIRSLLTQPRGKRAETAAPNPPAAPAIPVPVTRRSAPINAKREKIIAQLQEANANSTGMSLGSMLEFRANVEREKAGFEVKPPLSLVEYAGAYNKLKLARGGDCFNAPDAAHDFRFDPSTKRQSVPNIDDALRFGGKRR